ncbi:MAG: DUF2335 domain-containing protein [Kiritimatiellae bacterium]|nr:DUF2335 domain-containing protein [Kiritimatiellia bacterium]
MTHPLKRTDAPARQEVSGISIQQQIHSGPLPPPEALQLYEAALPGLAERIVSMAEAEQRERFRREDFRHEEAMLASRHAFQAERLGQIFALIASLCLISGSVVCVVLGSPWIGAALAGTTLVGVVSAFIGRRKASKQSGGN